MSYAPKLLLLLTFNKIEQKRIIDNILKFFNFDTKNDQNLLRYFNFIQFLSDVEINDASRQNVFPSKNILNTPIYSCVLFSNKSSTYEEADDDLSNDDNWKYHHKVEMKDERGQVVARQVFYELSPQLPLFCKSSWIPPPMLRYQDERTNEILERKHIIRLNINCRNYEQMVVFYRLLFEKYSNYTKKNFTVFILNDQNHSQRNDDKIEFQLSLKFDPNIAPYQLNHANLVYCIDSREDFESTICLLASFCDEVVENKIYSVFDPDGNRIYLVDSSDEAKRDSFKSFSVFNSTGLADYVNRSMNRNFVKFTKPAQQSPMTDSSSSSIISTSCSYYNETSQQQQQQQQQKLITTKQSPPSFSPDSCTSSNSCESTSADSGKDSGRWSSYSTNFNEQDPHNINLIRKNQELRNSINKKKLTNNENFNQTEQQQQYRNPRNLTSQKPDYVNVQNLIKQFNNNNNHSDMSKTTSSSTESEDVDNSSIINNNNNNRNNTNVKRKDDYYRLCKLKIAASKNNSYKKQMQQIQQQQQQQSRINEINDRSDVYSPYLDEPDIGHIQSSELDHFDEENYAGILRKKSKSVTFVDMVDKNRYRNMYRPASSLGHYISTDKYNDESNEDTHVRPKSCLPFQNNYDHHKMNDYVAEGYERSNNYNYQNTNYNNNGNNFNAPTDYYYQNNDYMTQNMHKKSQFTNSARYNQNVPNRNNTQSYAIQQSYIYDVKQVAGQERILKIQTHNSPNTVANMQRDRQNTFNELRKDYKKFNLAIMNMNQNNNNINTQIMYDTNNNFNSSSNNSFIMQKPYVGITPESRTRKVNTLNIVRSTKMPVAQDRDHVVVTDKYNNKLILPVAKF